MELDERLPTAARPDLASGNENVATDGTAIGRSPGELSFVEHGSRPRHDPRAPMRPAGRILPAVDGRRGQARAREGHVKEGETLMSPGHASTIAGRSAGPAGTISRCDPADLSTRVQRHASTAKTPGTLATCP